MAKNKLSDLRNHLFETLEALKDPEKPMDIERAQAVCNVAHELIETAKVEVKFMDVTGAAVGDEFFENPERVSKRALMAARMDRPA